jgi:hypothetical protein
VEALVLSQYLDEQFFPSPRATSRAALAGNDGSHQVRVLKGRPRTTSIALEHDLFWTPLVDSAEGLYFFFVVRWDALDNLHTITSSLLVP